MKTEELCSEFDKLPDESTRRAFVDRSPELLKSDVVEQLADAVRTTVRVNVPQALRLAEGALLIAEGLDDKEALARALRAKANALWFMGQCKPAVELFQEAAVLFEEAGNMNELGRTLSSSIQSLALLGEYENAFAAAERARSIFTSLCESWRVARVEINLANIYHRQNRFAEALAAYERAYEQLLPHKDMEGIGVALHNMAVCLIALDDFSGALKAYQRVRTVCEQHAMPLLVAQADYNIAYLYYLRGDYTQALEGLRATREICRKNGDMYHLALCDLDQSEIYLELSLIDEAAEMAENSFRNFQQLGMGYEAAKSLANLATAVSLKGDSSRGLDLFAQAREMLCRENNQAWPSLIDLYRALVLFERNDSNDLMEARRLCASALEMFRKLQLPSKDALCHLLLTRICLRAGEPEEAARRCDEALQLVGNLNSPILSYQAHFSRGQVHEALQQPEEAYRSYQASRSALEGLRSTLQKEELKIGLMKNRLEVYGRLIELCLDRDSGNAPAEEAFSYIEAAKCRALRDLILGRIGTREEAEENESDRRIHDLRKELNWYYNRVELEELSREGHSREVLEDLRDQAQTREYELLRHLRSAPASGRVGAALRCSSAVGLEDVRHVLGPEDSLIEYFEIDDRIFAATVTAKDIKIVCLTRSSAVLDRLRMLQFQLSKFRLASDYVSRFEEALLRATQAHLRGLYEGLFAPLANSVRGQHLVVVPYGPLHSLPFHALFDGSRYLIDRFCLSYAPSASIYVHCHRVSIANRKRSLVLGIEDPRLCFVREEVQAVAAEVPTPEVLLGAEATAQALRDKGRYSSVIHIATHGYFRQDSPMFSAIRLADSYVTLYDLYHMNLPADLLTLSGCVTGLDVIEKGDELLGLSRGLLYAGARSLLLSLWDVDDRSTSEFMKLFYTGIRHRKNKAEALQGAMVELRRRYPHPYYWAPFKLIGNTASG